MRTARVVTAAALVLMTVAGVLFGRSRVAQSRARLEVVQEQMANAWHEFHDDVAADEARWRTDPLFEARDGGDAAKVLFAHIRWERDGKAPPVPEALVAALKSPDGGWSQPQRQALAPIDTAWMGALHGYGHWDVEPLDGPLEGKPFQPISEPLPSFIDVQHLAKVRFAQGIEEGDARGAARDVREVARLLLTTEHLIGEMVAVALVGMERRVHAAAVERGQEVTGWQPYSEAEVKSLKRLLWVASAPQSLAATGELAQATLPLGSCAALREAVTFGHLLRGYAEELLPERYDAIGKRLTTSGCRLRRARAAWSSKTHDGQLPVDGTALCTDALVQQPSKCAVPRWITSVPFVRPYIGYTLVSLASTDWFKGYRRNVSD